MLSSTAAHSRSFIMECVDRVQATMHLEYALTARDVREIRCLIHTLPSPVRVLRVQLRASEANQYTMAALWEIIQAWRPRGTLHLVFLGGVAASGESRGTPTFAGSVDPEWNSPAHTAAFL